MLTHALLGYPGPCSPWVLSSFPAPLVVLIIEKWHILVFSVSFSVLSFPSEPFSK